MNPDKSKAVLLRGEGKDWYVRSMVGKRYLENASELKYLRFVSQYVAASGMSIEG